jgi:hypothetical protein
MNPVLTALIVGVGLGLLAGSYVGRWRAEMGRARRDMKQTWRNRKSYRS